jgi:hypothetical protein
MPIGGKVRAWAVAIAVVAAMCGFVPAAQALPGNFWGVVPQTIPTPEQFQRLKRGGVDSVRIPITWSAVQLSSNGAFNWAGIDLQVEEASRAGIEVLPFLSGAPAWTVPSVFVAGSHHSVKAPAHLPVNGPSRTGWIAFVKAAVARYGPSGSFWVEHPTVPKYPIRTWQVWNEENFKYFVAKPNPAEYGKLVKLSYGAIKAVDPAAQVVLGGMFAQPKGGRSKAKPKRVYFATDFLNQMYERTPGVKAKFNGVALHPYTGSYQQLKPDIEEFRAVLSANHDAGKGLWITELGWSSQPPAPATNIFAKGVSGQAQQLKGAFTLLKHNQAKWRLRQIYWFSVDDQVGACNFCDGSGLFGPGFAPKPAWSAYVRFAGGSVE